MAELEQTGQGLSVGCFWVSIVPIPSPYRTDSLASWNGEAGLSQHLFSALHPSAPGLTSMLSKWYPSQHKWEVRCSALVYLICNYHSPSTHRETDTFSALIPRLSSNLIFMLTLVTWDKSLCPSEPRFQAVYEGSSSRPEITGMCDDRGTCSQLPTTGCEETMPAQGGRISVLSVVLIPGAWLRSTFQT